MATTATGTTNTRSNSCVNVQLDCMEMWSVAQQFAYARLTIHTGPFRGKLLAFANVRARRIASIYARFYLETEESGTPTLKGRYYWMALGAFASKTVACSLEMTRVQALPPVYEGLAQGNFWLFMDVTAWHWYWNKSPGSFWTCEPARRADSCVPQVRKVIDILPWAAESLPKINQLQTNEFVHQGFKLVEEIEQMQLGNKNRPAKQLAHLMQLAMHEQGKVLQPLIYENESFTRWLRVQRSPWASWASPVLDVSFAAACNVDDPALKSVAPEGTELESYESRMKWIGSIAEKFHFLMQTQTAYMEDELRTMASWVNMSDGVPSLPLLSPP